MPIINQEAVESGFLVTTENHATFLHDFGPGRICPTGSFQDATLFETFDIAEDHRIKRVEAGEGYFKKVIQVQIAYKLTIVN